ncbi:MAG: hypothetical protein KC502_02205 [Myxococcales bacterium]|nr:hypothetical protein [Myxococcales bacterium]
MVQTLMLFSLVLGLAMSPATQKEIHIDGINTAKADVMRMTAKRVVGGFDMTTRYKGKPRLMMTLRSARKRGLWHVRIGGKGEPMSIKIGKPLKTLKRFDKHPRQTFAHKDGKVTLRFEGKSLYVFTERESTVWRLH